MGATKSLTNAQKKDLFVMLDCAMKIFRGDSQFVYDEIGFGDLKDIYSMPGAYWKQYHYYSSALPMMNIQVVTEPDPTNFSDDWALVPLVPVSFYLQFYSSVYGVDRRELEGHLALEAYWIDGEGGRHEGNSLPSFPPLLRQHVYRYRAKEQATSSRFPVDVDFFYFEPKDGDENREPSLYAIKITRSYPYITPEMRKKKREEEQQKKPD
ncbi:MULTISPECIES: hypothetical protein [Paraburkholderia]|nr:MULTISPECIES: hypothetical protein [Paraburkholderia]